jgi:hypothetical protein
LISTIGEALNLGWKLSVYCRLDKRGGMTTIRACTAYVQVDLETLVWTRGRNFPIAHVDTRMKCARCGSRRVLVAFEPPRTQLAGVTPLDETDRVISTSGIGAVLAFLGASCVKFTHNSVVSILTGGPPPDKPV